MGIPIAIGFMLFIIPGVLLSLYWFHAPMLAADGRKTLDALSESGRIFQRRKDWAAYFLNWLVLLVLCAVASVTSGIATIVTLPLTLAYLVYCYTDETSQVPLTLPRREVVV